MGRERGRVRGRSGRAGGRSGHERGRSGDEDRAHQPVSCRAVAPATTPTRRVHFATALASTDTMPARLGLIRSVARPWASVRTVPAKPAPCRRTFASPRLWPPAVRRIRTRVALRAFRLAGVTEIERHVGAGRAAIFAFSPQPGTTTLIRVAPLAGRAANENLPAAEVFNTSVLWPECATRTAWPGTTRPSRATTR